MNGPFWSLSDPKRPKPNYLVDRTGPDWSLLVFTSKDLAEAWKRFPKCGHMELVEIRSYEELRSLCSFLKEAFPSILWLLIYGNAQLPKQYAVSRLPSHKTARK
jgi:hypothetical protein